MLMYEMFHQPLPSESKKEPFTPAHKGGIEGPGGPVNTVALSETVCIARPLFNQGHTHLMDD